MSYSPLQKQVHIESVRSIMITKPMATVLEIQNDLANDEAWGLKLSTHYVASLRHAILKERTSRLHRANLGIRIAKFQDSIREAQKRLMKIYDEGKNPIARVVAMKEFIAAEKILLEAEMNSGIYEQKPGTMRVVPQLTVEQKTQVIEVMKKWRIVRDVTEVSTTEPSDESLARITAG